MQPGELGLFLSGELLPCSGECRRCRTQPAAVALPSGRGGSGEEQGEGPQPSGGGDGGRWWGRGGLPRAPPARVGLPREEEAAAAAEAAAPPPPPPPGVCVAMAGPPRPPPPVGAARVGLILREAGAARGRPPPGALALPPPLLVGLPCCCCCCLSWKGTVARMGWRRLPAPAPPPAAAAPPPPREVAGVGEPLRLTRWWDIVRGEPELAEDRRWRGRRKTPAGPGGGPTPQAAATATAPCPPGRRAQPGIPRVASAASVRLINNSALAARPAPRALPLGAPPFGSRSYGAPIGCTARSGVAEPARGGRGGGSA